MTLRQKAIAAAKECYRFQLTKGRVLRTKYEDSLFLSETQDGQSHWVWTGIVPGTENILKRQWTVELKDNGALIAAYDQSAT